MIRAMTLTLLGALTLGLTACNNAPAPRMKATPAENPKDPWASYMSPDWDHDADYVLKDESGIEYIVLEAGPACEPGPGAVAHYEGRLTDGSTFDKSFGRGALGFSSTGVIMGWRKALDLMCPGDDWLVYIPSELGYGTRGSPPVIEPNADLIFRVILVDKYTEDEWLGRNFVE